MVLYTNSSEMLCRKSITHTCITPHILVEDGVIMMQNESQIYGAKLLTYYILQVIILCDRTCEKGPCRASFQNRVITAIGKSRL